MKLAFIIDPPDSLKPAKDSSIAMMRAAVARGHAVSVLEPADLLLRDHRVEAHARALQLAPQAAPGPWYQAGETSCGPLARFDAVLMRKDPPFDMNYVAATWLLELAEGDGARIFNRPRAIRDFNEKLAIARFPDWMAPTLVSARADDLRAFVCMQQDTVLKPLDGMGGAGVFRVRDDDPNLNVIIETLTAHGSRAIMAQRFLPAIAEGDKRILLVDGEPLPFALARIPAPGETRGNLAAGGQGRAQPLSPEDRALASAVGPALKAAGLFLVGLDVIGEHLTEINVTSPTCMVEITAQTGFDAADAVIAALERSA